MAIGVLGGVPVLTVPSWGCPGIFPCHAVILVEAGEPLDSHAHLANRAGRRPAARLLPWARSRVPSSVGYAASCGGDSRWHHTHAARTTHLAARARAQHHCSLLSPTVCDVSTSRLRSTRLHMQWTTRADRQKGAAGAPQQFTSPSGARSMEGGTGTVTGAFTPPIDAMPVFRAAGDAATA